MRPIPHRTTPGRTGPSCSCASIAIAVGVVFVLGVILAAVSMRPGPKPSGMADVGKITGLWMPASSVFVRGARIYTPLSLFPSPDSSSAYDTYLFVVEMPKQDAAGLADFLRQHRCASEFTGFTDAERKYFGLGKRVDGLRGYKARMYGQVTDCALLPGRTGFIRAYMVSLPVNPGLPPWER